MIWPYHPRSGRCWIIRQHFPERSRIKPAKGAIVCVGSVMTKAVSESLRPGPPPGLLWSLKTAIIMREKGQGIGRASWLETGILETGINAFPH